MTDTWTYQPRYVAYARAYGMTPEEMDRHDQEHHPGASMIGYIGWINDRWREWESLTGRRTPHGETDHNAFDTWLAERKPPERDPWAANPGARPMPHPGTAAKGDR